MKQNTIQLSRDLLRKNGYLVDTVERFYHRRRHDYCGFADLIAWHPDIAGVLAVQTTNLANVGNHATAYTEGVIQTVLIDWLAPTRRLEIWGWGIKNLRNEDNSFRLTGKGKRKKGRQRRSIEITYRTGYFHLNEQSEIAP